MGEYFIKGYFITKITGKSGMNQGTSNKRLCFILILTIQTQKIKLNNMSKNKAF